MITCSYCSTEKEDSDFLRLPRSNILGGRCKACRVEYNLSRKEYRKKRYSEHKEEISAKTKAYQKANKEKIAKRKQEYREKNKEKLQAESRRRWASQSDDDRKRAIATRYGLTLDEYKSLFEKSGCACSICGSKTSKSSLDFCVDHCHTTGKVRGFLCHPCNKGLGAFYDNPIFLANAIKYLKEHE